MAYAFLGGGKSSSTTKKKASTTRTTSTARKTTPAPTKRYGGPQDIPSSKKTVQQPQKTAYSVQAIKKRIGGPQDIPSSKPQTTFHNVPTAAMANPSAAQKILSTISNLGKNIAKSWNETVQRYEQMPKNKGLVYYDTSSNQWRQIKSGADMNKALEYYGLMTSGLSGIGNTAKNATSAIERRLSTIKPKPIETVKPKSIQIKPIANRAAKEVAEEAIKTPGKQLLKESVEGATKLSKPAKSVLKEGVEQAAKQTFKEGAEQAARQTAKAAAREGVEALAGQTAEQVAKAATKSGLKNIANLAKKVLPYAAVGGAAALLATPSGKQQQPTMNQPETQQTPTGQQSTNNGWVDLKDVQSKLEQQYPTYPTSQAGIPTQTKTSQPGITSQTTQTKTSQPGITSQTTRQSQQPIMQEQPIIDTTTIMDNVNNSIEDLITLGTIELSKPDTSPDVLTVYNQYLSDILSSIEKRINDLKSTAEQQGKELDQSTLLSLDTLRQRLSDELKSVREELNRRGLYESGILLDLETKLRNNELSEEARILSERLNKIYDNLNNSLNQMYNAAIDVQSKYGLATADAYAKAKADYEQQRQDLLTKLINARLEQRSQLSKEQQAALDRQFKKQQAELDRQLKELQLKQENYWKQQNYNLQKQKAQTPKYSASATQAAISRIPNFSSREEALAVLQQELPILQAQGVDVNAVIQAINAYFGTK